ncbi:Ribosomal silencing factor RsfS [Helicobacter sp. NHP19-012]|uniref:Ribosomal silencing factor RsfS n=1 Tax=Helicobacter gastrofelis TaxID=2849642 RepID=A0ABM7SK70_9HELI|nr:MULTISPECIES: ribosome silencing factor [unclassified Helicobacter]BCZ18520.1 Ribosomal silencing factor RsfS [Helicobacter sp. NHP19-012]GMB95794.1 Ribosomal silencing factor RsfS [Helicobacter sp. NHP22-001]
MRIARIVALLEEKKAENVATFDLREQDYITEHVVIATALAGKHALALLDHLKTTLKPLGETFYAVDESNEEWIIIDLGDIMVHIFTQNYRERFDLDGFLKTYNKPH